MLMPSRSSDLPSEDMKARLDSVNQAIQDATKGNPDACEAKGAEIWLVPTSAKPLTEWQPIARRKLDDVVWKWVS